MKKTFKYIATLFLLLILGIQTNHLLISYGLFKMNQDNLTLLLCEKIIEDCDACCYLTKKMDENSEKTDPVDKNAEQRLMNIISFIIDNILHAGNTSGSNNYFISNGFQIMNTYLSPPDRPPES